MPSARILTHFTDLLLKSSWEEAFQQLQANPEILPDLIANKDWPSIRLILIHCASININLPLISKRYHSPSLLWSLAYYKQLGLFDLVLEKFSEFNFNVKPAIGKKKDLSLLSILARNGWWEELKQIIKQPIELDLSSLQIITEGEKFTYSVPILYQAYEAGRYDVIESLFIHHPKEFYRNLTVNLLLENSLQAFKGIVSVLKKAQLKIDMHYEPYGEDKFKSNMHRLLYVNDESELIGASVVVILGLSIHVFESGVETNLTVVRKKIDEIFAYLYDLKAEFPYLDGNKCIQVKSRYAGISLFWSMAYLDGWHVLLNWLENFPELIIDVNCVPSQERYKEMSLLYLTSEMAHKNPLAEKVLTIISERHSAPNIVLYPGNQNSILNNIAAVGPKSKKIIELLLNKSPELPPDFMLYLPCDNVKDLIFLLDAAFENPVSKLLDELFLPISMIYDSSVVNFLETKLPQTLIEKIYVLNEKNYEDFDINQIGINTILSDNSTKALLYSGIANLMGNPQKLNELFDLLKELMRSQHPLASVAFLTFIVNIIEYLDGDLLDLIKNECKGYLLIYLDNACFEIGRLLYLSDHPDKTIESYLYAMCFLSEALISGKNDLLLNHEVAKLFVAALAGYLNVNQELTASLSSLKNHEKYNDLIVEIIAKKQQLFCLQSNLNYQEDFSNKIRELQNKLINCTSVDELCQLMSITKIYEAGVKEFYEINQQIKAQTKFFESKMPSWQQQFSSIFGYTSSANANKLTYN